MSSREWRCNWSSADRPCSIYIWVIDNFVAYQGASCIRGFTVYCDFSQIKDWVCYRGSRHSSLIFKWIKPRHSRYRDSYVKDKTVARPSYLLHRDPMLVRRYLKIGMCMCVFLNISKESLNQETVPKYYIRQQMPYLYPVTVTYIFLLGIC